MTREDLAPLQDAMAELDRRRTDLDWVEQILATSTPSRIAALRDVLVHNGHPSTEVANQASIQSAANGHVKKVSSTSRGALIRAVEQAIKTMDVITSSAVLDHLNNHQRFKFVNENPIAPVSAILSKLRKRGKLILVRKGSGQRAAQFRKVGGAQRV